jgi:2-polyprenyl-3-methyl-5-hydroxy-6-metoxy-1,4-benzoquinol methylase
MELIVDEIPRGSRHLDMGCGVGFLLALSTAFRDTGPTVGVDIDEAALDLARTVLPDEESVRLIPLDRWNAAPEGDFDAVTLIDVLHHVPWGLRERFLTDLFSRIREGGRMIFKDIGLKPWWGAAANFMHDLVLSGERVRLTPIAQVEALAARSGLRLEKSLDLYRMYPHQLRVFTR